MKTINVKGVEKWREYEWTIPETGEQKVYRIDEPAEVHAGDTTHRVVDAKGVTHCVPAPGHFGCVLRWDGAVIA